MRAARAQMKIWLRLLISLMKRQDRASADVAGDAIRPVLERENLPGGFHSDEFD